MVHWQLICEDRSCIRRMRGDMPGDTSQRGPQSGQPCSRHVSASWVGHFPARVRVCVVVNAKQPQQLGISLVPRGLIPRCEFAASQHDCNRYWVSESEANLCPTDCGTPSCPTIRRLRPLMRGYATCCLPADFDKLDRTDRKGSHVDMVQIFGGASLTAKDGKAKT